MKIVVLEGSPNKNGSSNMLVDETDIGRRRKEQIADLRRLLEAFRAGVILEKHGRLAREA